MSGRLIGLGIYWLDKVSGGDVERMAASEVEGMTICETFGCLLPWPAMNGSPGAPPFFRLHDR